MGIDYYDNMSNTIANKTVLYDEEFIKVNVRHKFDELEKKLKNINKILTNDLLVINKNTYQFMIDFLKPQDRLEHIIFYYMLNLAHKSEILSQGSAYSSLIFCLNLSKELFKNDIDISQFYILEEYEKITQKLKIIIENKSKQITKNHLYTILNDISENDLITKISNEALILAGLEGKIFIEDGKQKNYIIEQKYGYSFKVKPFKFFLNSSTFSWEKTNVKLLIVDGLIEKVSELDQILQKTFDSKQPLAIISHGFSEEVIATLKANQERKNFEAIPIKINPDTNSINLINDLAVVCGTTPVSFLKGDMLIFTKYEELPTVNKLLCNENEITIENPSSNLSVNSHIKYLLEKRNDPTLVEDVINIIDNRLKSLVSKSIIIHLPEMTMVNKEMIRIKLDNIFRAAKTLLNYGIVNISDICDEFLKQNPKSSFLEKSIINSLKTINIENKNIPTLSAFNTLCISGKAMLLFLSSNNIIALET